jgi:hypothetical protein
MDELATQQLLPGRPKVRNPVKGRFTSLKLKQDGTANAISSELPNVTYQPVDSNNPAVHHCNVIKSFFRNGS